MSTCNHLWQVTRSYGALRVGDAITVTATRDPSDEFGAMQG